MSKKIDLNEFYANLSKSISLYTDILGNYVKNLPPRPPQIDPLNINMAFFEAFQSLSHEPEKFAEENLKLYKKLSQDWVEAAESFLKQKPQPEDNIRDRRFQGQDWANSPYFRFMRNAYLTYADWLTHLTRNIKGMDAKDKAKLEFYTRQFIDAISPSNYLATNPEVLRATLETNAENLVKGLKRLAEDVARGNISQTDYSAFEVGKNIATTPGKVVFQNDLMQLIQYEASTKEVYKTPLLFVPAWINKYYIADLRPDNSFVKWLVDHGYTLFMVSWVNPDEKLKDKDFADYMQEGPLAAIGEIKKITGEDEVNIIGYCLGGTLTATMLAYLKAKGEKLVKSATFLTTLLDFKEAGELGIFIDEPQVQYLEKRMSEQGFLEGKEMAMTFSMLRANDLIWSFVVNNYLLGKDPFPFDLLYWNSDSTRMPAKMHSFYLRNMYLNNNLAHKKLKLLGVDIDLSKIDTPSYFLSTAKDHIAPWKSTFAGAKMFKDACFTLADSGHIAGVVNPPKNSKYPHWINDHVGKSADEWMKTAVEEAGSWWVNWKKWAEKYSGKKVPARKIGKSIEDAPGSYVKVRS